MEDFQKAELSWEQVNDLQTVYEIMIHGTDEEREILMDVVSFIHKPILLRIAQKMSGLRTVVIHDLRVDSAS